jgi:hypothetical protein
MENECDHVDGSLVGKCAICGRTVCSECYREVFSEMICEVHEDLEDESAWELVGFYADSATLAQRRFLLEEQGISSIVVEADGDTIELYVAMEEKEDAFASLSASTEDAMICADCRIQYSAEMVACPLCGVKPVE